MKRPGRIGTIAALVTVIGLAGCSGGGTRFVKPGTAGGLLLVSQFTLAADTNSGTRPSFTPAAPPDEGKRLFDYFVAQARKRHPIVETGAFGAMMQVALVNDGPVTFWLETA